MGVKKATFQSAGQLSQHLLPGAYSRIDSIKGSVGFVSVNNGVIMGQCTGGTPNTLLQFNTLGDAVRTLKGGPLMEAVRLAFNPGNGYVPQRLYAMRVNSALQSSCYLKDGSSNNMVKLLSNDYGLDQNQLKAKLEAGSSSGKKLTLEYKTKSEVYDNIIRNSFTIQHSSACTMTIVNNSTTHTLTISVGPVEVDLTSYPTIGSLVAYLSSISNVTASVIAGQEDVSSLELDSVTAVDINSSAYTAQSTMEAIIDTVNSGSVLVTASDVSGANNRVIPANLSLTYFTGGSEGSYTSTEWSSALETLEAEDIQFISTPDSSASVHSAIQTHCVLMSAVTGRKERQFLVGGAWAESSSTAISASATLNTGTGLRVFNGGTQRDVNGVIQNFDASYVACMLLGMTCSMAINMPLTFKTLNLISVENKLSDATMEALIEGGVCPINYNAQGIPHVVRQITTYQADDIKYNEFSSVKEMFFVSRDLRSYLEGLFIGQPGLLIGDVMLGIVRSRLQQYVDLGVFTTGEEGSFWGLSISLNEDQLIIDYTAYITLPINFIFITNHFTTVVALATAA